MEAPSIRIGNQTSCQVPARLPYEFALRHGFEAFEWFSDRGPAGWCEADMNAGERRRLREEATEHGVLFSVHAPVAANPIRPGGAAEIRRSIAFAGDRGVGGADLAVELALSLDHRVDPAGLGGTGDLLLEVDQIGQALLVRIEERSARRLDGVDQ